MNCRHTKLDQLTRRVNYQGLELATSLENKKKALEDEAPVVVYADAEKNNKGGANAMMVEMPNTLYSAAIIFPLVSGASGPSCGVRGVVLSCGVRGVDVSRLYSRGG
jgi:hypothetical protein